MTRPSPDCLSHTSAFQTVEDDSCINEVDD